MGHVAIAAATIHRLSPPRPGARTMHGPGAPPLPGLHRPPSTLAWRAQAPRSPARARPATVPVASEFGIRPTRQRPGCAHRSVRVWYSPFAAGHVLHAIQRREEPARRRTLRSTSLERDGQTAHAVILARTYATTHADLWDAVTSAQRIPNWFLPITGNLELGGSYQLEGNAGGRITACSPPSSYAITWEFGGFVTWVDVQIAAEGIDRARLTITHTAHHSEHWDTFGPGATGVGFEMGLLGFAPAPHRP